MAVWSEVEVRGFDFHNRIDAEYFRPEFLLIENKLRSLNAVPLSSIAGYIKRGVQPCYDEDGKIEALRSVNIRSGSISDTRQEYVSDMFFKDNPRGQVGYGDVLIASTGVGTLGRVAYNYRNQPMFADGHITILRGIEKRNSQFIALFLQSKIGAAMIERRQRGSSGQIEIYPDDIGSLPIPNLDEATEEEIAGRCEDAQGKIEQAKTLYAEAENLLLHELGLDTLDLSHELTYERDFAEVAAADRFDAQYFAPRYQRAMAVMRRDKRTIGGVAPLAKSFFRPSPNEPFDYIEIGNLTGNGHAESERLMGADAPSRAQWVVHENDVITSTVRPIRRLTALVEPSQSEFVCSSGFVVLEPKAIAPEVLTVYLRLPIVCEILDLHTTATMYPAIATETLLSIPISQPDETATNEIIRKVRQSRRAREDAKQLLEDAKRQVERLILGEEAERVA